MLVRRWSRGWLIALALLFLATCVRPADALARPGSSSSSIGGSVSGGEPKYEPSRGPRKPTQPTKPAPAAVPTPAPAPAGGFWRSLGGGLLGALAGGLLFRSLFGYPAYGGLAGSGIGPLELLLLAGVAYLIYRYFKKRGMRAAATADSSRRGATAIPAYQPQYQAAYDRLEGRAPPRDLGQGLKDIRQLDPSFEADKFRELGMDTFFRIQGAWANRDMSPVHQLLTEEMYLTLQEDVDRLRAAKKINRLENIAVRAVELTEAWQESGADYITLRIFASMLDYNVDETTGQVVEGSKLEPVKFEEYWTFTRSVGNNPWQLSAIHQPD